MDRRGQAAQLEISELLIAFFKERVGVRRFLASGIDLGSDCPRPILLVASSLGLVIPWLQIQQDEAGNGDGDAEAREQADKLMRE